MCIVARGSRGTAERERSIISTACLVRLAEGIDSISLVAEHSARRTTLSVGRSSISQISSTDFRLVALASRQVPLAALLISILGHTAWSHSEISTAEFVAIAVEASRCRGSTCRRAIVGDRSGSGCRRCWRRSWRWYVARLAHLHYRISTTEVSKLLIADGITSSISVSAESVGSIRIGGAIMGLRTITRVAHNLIVTALVSIRTLITSTLQCDGRTEQG